MITTSIEQNFQQALTYHHAGELTQAEKYYRAVLQIQSNHPTANHNLGFLLASIGKIEPALPFLKNAVELDNYQVLFWLDYIDVLIRANKLDLASLILAQALDIGLHGEQTDSLLELLQVKMRDSLNLKEINKQPPLKYLKKLDKLFSQKYTVEAEKYSRELIEQYPKCGYAWKILSVIVGAKIKSHEAMLIMRKTTTLLPNDAVVHANLGSYLYMNDQFYEAEICLRKSLSIKETAHAHYNLGLVLVQKMQFVEAEHNLTMALKLKPNFISALVERMVLYNYLPKYKSHEFCLSEAKRFGSLIKNKVKNRYSTWQCEFEPKKLKIGFISGDFREHVVSFYLDNILKNLQYTSCELIAYSTFHEKDDFTSKIQSYFSKWNSIHNLGDEDVANLIHNEGIHILIDLSGHTKYNRLEVFAWKPAPIQVSWLGYYATTGVEEMDYILGDPFVTPASEAHHFTEKVWSLPNSYYCFTPPNFSIDVTPLPAIKNGFITFGCFNNLAKMNDSVVELWARVLKAVPNSKLFLKSKQLHDKIICEKTFERFKIHGIELQRLILEGSAPREEFLRSYSRVDIALDPFPYPGGTTSIESLWMAVPVLTLRGDCFLSHVGESIAYNAGLSNWIALDADDYIAKAVDLTANLELLALLRQNLRAQFLSSPIVDAEKFAIQFKDALWAMWSNYSSS